GLVAVEARVDRPAHVVVLGVAGEGHELDLAPARQAAQPAGGLVAVHAGHADVDEAQLGTTARERGERRGAVVHGPGRVPEATEQRGQQVGCVPVVVDDEDSHALPRALPSRRGAARRRTRGAAYSDTSPGMRGARKARVGRWGYDAPMSRTSATAWLESHRNDDGSWGYVPGSSGRPEPVLHCAALGLEVPLDWLRRADLGYAQLLLPAALARTPGAEDLCRRTLDVILALRGKTQEPHP